MFNDIKESNVASWDLEAWTKALKKIMDDNKEVNSKVVKVAESENVEKVDVSKNIDKKAE